jgi:hypothetical protein
MWSMKVVGELEKQEKDKKSKGIGIGHFGAYCNLKQTPPMRAGEG